MMHRFLWLRVMMFLYSGLLHSCPCLYMCVYIEGNAIYIWVLYNQAKLVNLVCIYNIAPSIISPLNIYKRSSQQHSYRYMKQLTSSLPLVYLLPQSHLITALPYIDQQQPQYKNRIQYMIKSQQQNMQYSQQKYIGDLNMGNKTKYVDTQEFQQQAKRIKEKIQAQRQQKADKNKDKQKQKSLYDQITMNLIMKNGNISEQNKKKIQKAVIHYQNNIMKQINLQLIYKLGPTVQKQIISALDKRKQALVTELQKYKKDIEQINKERQYNQYQARERQQTIKERLKVMIYKKKKIAQ